MKLVPQNGDIVFYSKYSTHGDNPLFGQVYDSQFIFSKRTKFIPRERKMVYIIPYFEDQLTKRMNRNVRAEFFFDHYGWKKLMKYVISYMK